MSDLMQQLTDPATRPDPWPIYAKFRTEQVVPIGDGGHAVGRYDDVRALLGDPRLSSKVIAAPGDPAVDWLVEHPPFISTDPPSHDFLRQAVMRAFGPPASPDVVMGQDVPIGHDIEALISRFPAAGQVDIAEQFAYPLPVSAICRLLGVPREDEPRFRGWADDIVRGLDARHQANTEELAAGRNKAMLALAGYIAELISRHRAEPDSSMLSELVTDGRLSDTDIQVTGVLLFMAGHETTVNLITNGMLTLLRNPEALRRLRRDPSWAPAVVEELLRYEPPVQYIASRSALTTFTFGGTTIPEGSNVVLLLGAANRDPARFSDPDRFDPDRDDIQHLGFGGGIHYCFGAPLARLEGARALAALAQRLDNPRLVEDPPPYRASPVLRGPSRLLVAYDRLLG